MNYSINKDEIEIILDAIELLNNDMIYDNFRKLDYTRQDVSKLWHNITDQRYNQNKLTE